MPLFKPLISLQANNSSRVLISLPIAQFSDSIDHGLQCRTGFFPAASLETAIRVDPQALYWDFLGSALHELDHPILVRYEWRVNVINPRTDIIGIVEILKGIEQLHVRARGFNSNYISV